MYEDIFKAEISEKIAQASGVDREEIYNLLESPRDRKMGDIALPCFVLAKQLKKAPQQIASEIVEKSSGLAWALISEVKAVGPFLNFFYDAGAVAESVIDSARAGGYGSSEIGAKKNIVIDFSSPNIAKPFGVGHLRTTIIGNALYHIFEKLGYNCVGVNHLGDWGTQFGKMIVAFREWGSEELSSKEPVLGLLELYTRFHREAKTNPELDEEARKQFKLLEEGDAEVVELWEKFKAISLEEFKRVYEILGIEFDHYTGESYYNDKMERVLEILDDKKLTKISQEALIVDLEQYDLGACLLKKGDDATLYATRDLAAVLYRWETFEYVKCLYVVAAAQSLHFQQLFKVAQLADIGNYEGLVHVPFGWVRFGDKAMSTREGNIILLDDVISKARELAREVILEKNPDIEDIDTTAGKIGVGAIIFSQLSVRRMKDIDFRWEDALSFEGETGPYLQYTHARLCSLGRKFGREVPSEIDYGLLAEPEEKRVLLSLMQYPGKVKQAGDEYEPFVISAYLIDLAQDFNTFYQKHRVITSDDALSEARMALCESVKAVIGDGLRLLGIAPLERM